ncbi:hypothetical protein L210DRAFT_3531682 [Boletus edulis BED1]|uniref:Transmembrane protein n=1 Tax=Boletus edulis BED1 TaxID=1328754 RepID=A0AAD4C1S9_BOLED|nr:hypothetical protein L210DRAFT_3531682 [Boletus edulis BED1]
MSTIHAAESSRPWRFTVLRAHGLQHLRAEKSWRPIVTVTVGDHQCHELNLGCDGQNPNLKECFQFHDIDTSSRVDICVYHRAPSKKKNKKRNLVASACCTLQELARLQAQQQCKQKSVEIILNCASRHKGGGNKQKTTAVLLVAKLDMPEVCQAQPTCVQEDVGSDILSESEDQEHSSSPTSDSGDSSFVWPETNHPEPKVHTGYWSDSDHAQSEDERDPLIKHRENESILVLPLSDSEDNDHIDSAGRRFWFAASILPTYTETIAVDSPISSVDSIVDSFSPYRALREAQVDSDYERVLTELGAEWRFVGGSLVALAGLEAGVFGFSSAAPFQITNLAKRAIAVGSIASGIGLAIDAWFLLVYCNATPAKFQKMALDVYGKYLFFCVSARIPALCMFTSACALMTFMLSVAWTAWPSAVLFMSFIAGVLISLQFIVYGLHCIVVFIAEVARSIRRGIFRCLAWIRPPPPENQEKHALEK